MGKRRGIPAAHDRRSTIVQDIYDAIHKLAILETQDYGPRSTVRKAILKSVRDLRLNCARCCRADSTRRSHASDGRMQDAVQISLQSKCFLGLSDRALQFKIGERLDMPATHYVYSCDAAYVPSNVDVLTWRCQH